MQNKKIHYLSKKNQALKMENEGLTRLSMSPMCKPPLPLRTPTGTPQSYLCVYINTQTDRQTDRHTHTRTHTHIAIYVLSYEYVL